jgi:uncharacterized protein (DUF934 family)
MKLIAHDAHSTMAFGTSGSEVLVLANDADAQSADLTGVRRVDLHFPKFSDGRAYSQAVVLRRRRGFTGEIRATGDVLLDQILLMQRTGFDSAVLRADQNAGHVTKLLAQFPGFYQGDAQQARPRFAAVAA